jgi:hypothetical protein
MEVVDGQFGYGVSVDLGMCSAPLDFQFLRQMSRKIDVRIGIQFNVNLNYET